MNASELRIPAIEVRRGRSIAYSFAIDGSWFLVRCDLA